MTDHQEQPAPVPNDRPSIQGMVIDDLTERLKLGIQRYGTPLQAHNGRDALRDAYEEALDLACYLRQAIEERDNSEPGFHLKDRDGDIWVVQSDGWIRLKGGSTSRTVAEIDTHYGPLVPVKWEPLSSRG